MNTTLMQQTTQPATRAKVLISILNWNRAQKTLHCLESLRDQRAVT